jgi:hypothetical protein
VQLLGPWRATRPPHPSPSLRERLNFTLNYFRAFNFFFKSVLIELAAYRLLPQNRLVTQQ